MHATYFQETSHILSTLSDTFDSTCETPKIDFADFIDMLRVKVSAFARQLPNCIYVTKLYIYFFCLHFRCFHHSLSTDYHLWQKHFYQHHEIDYTRASDCKYPKHPRCLPSTAHYPECAYNTGDANAQLALELLKIHGLSHATNGAPLPPLTTAEKANRSKLAAEGTTDDWHYSLIRWKNYEEATGVTGKSLIINY